MGLSTHSWARLRWAGNSGTRGQQPRKATCTCVGHFVINERALQPRCLEQHINYQSCQWAESFIKWHICHPIEIAQRHRLPSIPHLLSTCEMLAPEDEQVVNPHSVLRKQRMFKALTVTFLTLNKQVSAWGSEWTWTAALWRLYPFVLFFTRPYLCGCFFRCTSAKSALRVLLLLSGFYNVLIQIPLMTYRVFRIWHCLQLSTLETTELIRTFWLNTWCHFHIADIPKGCWEGCFVLSHCSQK